MARTHWQQMLAEMKANEERMAALFDGLASQVSTVLLREAGPDGTIPQTRGRAVRDEVGTLVIALFLARSGETLVPFETSYGRVYPKSPYATALWTAVEAVTRIAVDQHRFYIERALKSEPELLNALRSASQNPFETALRVSEQGGFKPRPFVEYDPLHQFVREDGYTLSDRVWRVSVETRRKLDLILREGIAAGEGAQALAQKLEAFLQPGREAKRTNVYGKFGVEVSYDAMRLARTEITAAHSRAGWMAAQLNPFVSGYEIVLSPAHGCCDNCDIEAANGPYAIGDSSHLPPFHPYCMCHIRWVMDKNTDEVLDGMRAELAQMREDIRRSVPNGMAMLGPTRVADFVQMLLSDNPQAGASYA